MPSRSRTLAGKTLNSSSEPVVGDSARSTCAHLASCAGRDGRGLFQLHPHPAPDPDSCSFPRAQSISRRTQTPSATPSHACPRQMTKIREKGARTMPRRCVLKLQSAPLPSPCLRLLAAPTTLFHILRAASPERASRHASTVAALSIHPSDDRRPHKEAAPRAASDALIRLASKPRTRQMGVPPSFAPWPIARTARI